MLMRLGESLMYLRLVACLALTATPLVALGAEHDNNVEWSGVSHLPLFDRDPACPVDGESFAVRFQTWQYDITTARVYVDDGSATWVAAFFLEQRGPYDVWTAVLKATASDTLSYYIELTDGTDTDYLGPDGLSESPPTNGWLIDFATYGHAPLGATPSSDGGAIFRVWAPGATKANLAGEFNGWSMTSLPMTPLGDDYLLRVEPPVAHRNQYKYIFNGSNWKTDARARAMNQGNYGNSYLIDPQVYAWNDPDFVTPAFEDMIVYELHVGTFSGRNDGLNRMGRYRDVVDQHLDHLLYLGVNVVELMPITEFDYHESWGYNPINHWGPENAYGGPDDLKYMIDVLHQHGIAVVFDIVYNHYSGSGNYLWNYDGTQIYFDNPAVQTPWGSQADFDRPEVQDYFLENALYWLEEYHGDGFRMDATRFMRDNWIYPEGQPSGWELMRRFNDWIDRRKTQAISIAEELPNEIMITRATASGGAGFDSQWHDQFNDDIRQEIIDAAFGYPEMWRVRDAINAGDYPNKTTLLRYVESHDEADDARLAVVIDSNDPYSKWAKGRSKLAQGLTILVPGIPMFLQGGEWMEDTPFGSGSGNRIDWSKATSRAPIVRFIHDVIGLRKNNCGFRSNAGFNVFHVNDTDNVLAFHRWCASGNDLVVVASFKNADLHNYRIGLPQPGVWYELLNSQAAEYDGNGVGNAGQVTAEPMPYNGMPYSAEITIPEMGLLVFRFNEPLPLVGDLNCDGLVGFGDINPFILALSNPGEYEQRYPDCPFSNRDINADGKFDFDDINPFVKLLTNP